MARRARTRWRAELAEALGTRYLDNLYDGYRLCVELDGLQAHPDHKRWDDLRRTNAITAQGVTTLRYGWIDVDRWSCQTAAQIGAALRTRGWPGPLLRCGAGCPIANSVNNAIPGADSSRPIQSGGFPLPMAEKPPSR